MNFVKRMIELVPGLETPYGVKLLNSMPNTSSQTLVAQEGPLQLHQERHFYYIYMFLGPRVFQLCKVSTSMKPAVVTLFNKYKEQLLVLCEAVYKDMHNPLASLARSCDIIRNNKVTWTPLHVAVKTELTGIYSHHQFVHWLNSKEPEYEDTPLHLAIKLKLECIANELVVAGVVTSIPNKEGDTSFHCAVKCGFPNLLKNICRRTNSLHEVINMQNNSGDAPLHYACKYGDYNACKVLLDCGADMFLHGEVGLPIHYALKHKYTNILKLMLEYNHGIVFVTCRKHEALPLHWCKTHTDAELLFEYNTPINHSSKTGDHPIHIMSQRGRLEVAVSLVLKNVDINARGKDGNTPLHVAVGEGQQSLVKMLLLFGADHTLTNDFGETPYLIARRSNKPKRTKILDMLEPGESHGGQTDDDKPDCTSGYVNLECNPSLIGDDFFKRPKLLCLDGGGIRGLVLTQILIEIEKQTGKKCRDLFQWIAGTSTGGILAIALAQGKSAVYCQRLYLAMKDKVFIGSRPYNVEPLEKFLQEEFGENTTMRSLGDKTKIIIPATMADRKPVQLHLFTNYSVPESKTSQNQFKFSKKLSKGQLQEFTMNEPPEDQLLWKVARCTGAAPTFFASHDKFLDGGLIANNPTLDAMTGIHNYYKALGDCTSSSSKLALVLSLGTGQNPTTKARSLDVKFSTNPAEMIPSLFNAYELQHILVDTITEANTFVVNRAKAWCESQGTEYFRLNPFMNEDIPLDEVDDTKLMDLLWDTQTYVRENMSTIEEIVQLLWC